MSGMDDHLIEHLTEAIGARAAGEDLPGVSVENLDTQLESTPEAQAELASMQKLVAVLKGSAIASDADRIERVRSAISEERRTDGQDSSPVPDTSFTDRMIANRSWLIAASVVLGLGLATVIILLSDPGRGPEDESIGTISRDDGGTSGQDSTSTGTIGSETNQGGPSGELPANSDRLLLNEMISDLGMEPATVLLRAGDIDPGFGSTPPGRAAGAPPGRGGTGSEGAGSGSSGGSEGAGSGSGLALEEMIAARVDFVLYKPSLLPQGFTLKRAKVLSGMAVKLTFDLVWLEYGGKEGSILLFQTGSSDAAQKFFTDQTLPEGWAGTSADQDETSLLLLSQCLDAEALELVAKKLEAVQK